MTQFFSYEISQPTRVSRFIFFHLEASFVAHFVWDDELCELENVNTKQRSSKAVADEIRVNFYWISLIISSFIFLLQLRYGAFWSRKCTPTGESARHKVGGWHSQRRRDHKTQRSTGLHARGAVSCQSE